MGRILDQDDGLRVYAKNLIDELAVLDRDTRYVVLLRTDQFESAFSQHENVETRVLPAKVKTFWDQVTVPLAAHRMKADLILNPKFSVPLLSMQPSIFVLHGSDWYINPDNYEWWDNIYIRVLLPIYCRKATALMAISQTIVNDLVRYAGVDPDKAHVSGDEGERRWTPYWWPALRVWRWRWPGDGVSPWSTSGGSYERRIRFASRARSRLC